LRIRETYKHIGIKEVALKTRNINILAYLAFALFLLSQSCSQTRYLPEGEYLLNKYTIEENTGDIPPEEFKNYIKQKPNKKILGWKFWLSVYNLSGENDSLWINRYLRKIGEPPVIYSEDLKENTTRQLQLFLFNKGYFNAAVTDSTVFHKKNKAKVIYEITPGPYYTIRNVDYFFEDASLSRFILSDSVPPVLKSGQKYDIEILEAERSRVTDILGNRGYYNFNRGFIGFNADTNIGYHEVDITMVIKNFPQVNERGRITRTSHPVYHIRNVYMVSEKDQTGMTQPFNVLPEVGLDSDSVYVIEQEDQNIRHGLITQKNYIMPGSLYNTRRVQQTYRNLNALSAFQLVDINFREVPGEEKLLDCEIKMLPAIRQAFTGAIEGTTSGGNIGAAGNLNYQHRNLFGGSEQFDLTFLGAIETLPENKDVSGEQFGSMQEVGVEAKLSVPKFLLPFSTEQFIRKFNPETNINLSFNYQHRPDFTRTTLRGSFGYRWRGNRYVTHTIYPFDISLINTPHLSDEFKAQLEGTYLYYSYLPHFITDQRYRMVYTNQKLNKTSDFQYVRLGIETAGNMIYGLYQLYKSAGLPYTDESLKILGVDYAQYIRTDIDVRHYDYHGEDNSLVYRGFVGIAYPYLNSIAIPFEKQFFGGGANSLRAWRVKDLGPGSYAGDTTRYPNQTADLKIEANIEYRFKLIWKAEGALFLDAGNIWSLSKEDDREGAVFDLSKFYREFAVGTGFGVRFDFNFFIFRVDIGIPLVDPSFPEGQRWVPANADLQWNDLGYNFAIGYPF